MTGGRCLGASYPCTRPTLSLLSAMMWRCPLIALNGHLFFFPRAGGWATRNWPLTCLKPRIKITALIFTLFLSGIWPLWWDCFCHSLPPSNLLSSSCLWGQFFRIFTINFHFSYLHYLFTHTHTRMCILVTHAGHSIPCWSWGSFYHVGSGMELSLGGRWLNLLSHLHDSFVLSDHMSSVPIR